MNILFICRHNRFRSKTAEAFFNKMNDNKDNHAKSAGLIQNNSPINPIHSKVAGEYGIKLSSPMQPISLDLLRWQDVAIIVADNVPPEILLGQKYAKKVIQWKIRDVEDPTTDDEERIRVAISSIKARVSRLLEDLK